MPKHVVKYDFFVKKNLDECEEIPKAARVFATKFYEKLAAKNPQAFEFRPNAKINIEFQKIKNWYAITYSTEGKQFAQKWYKPRINSQSM